MKNNKSHRQIREIRIIDLFFYFYLSICFLIVIWVFFGVGVTHTKQAELCAESKHAVLMLAITVAVTASYFPVRNLLLGCVLMYKAYAPLEVREKCRFVPTCSTYMIMSIKKYGIVIGVIKGICRLLRCKPPNGGEDYP